PFCPRCPGAGCGSGGWTWRAGRRLRHGWRTWSKPTAPPHWARGTPRSTPSSTCWRPSPGTESTMRSSSWMPMNRRLDGSAREYCRMVESAGIVPQPEKRNPYLISEPIELQMGETEMAVFPNDILKITCTSADKLGRFTQFYSLEISPKTWQEELAHARTFCFYEEIEFLIKN